MTESRPITLSAPWLTQDQPWCAAAYPGVRCQSKCTNIPSHDSCESQSVLPRVSP